MLRILRIAAIIVAGTASARAQTVENYPQGPIHFVVGFAAGGGADVVARAVGQTLSERLGKPVIIDNKTGATGMIAAESVAKAKPDGLTLLFSTSSTLTINPVLHKTVPFATRDFIPITMVVKFPFFLLVNENQPIKNVNELREYLKAHPDKANSSGGGTIHQLAYALFKSRTGTTGEFIPYRGTNKAILAVMAGDVLMTIADAGPASPLLKAGKVRALAVSSSERLDTFPDVPTFAEAGLPDMAIESWFGLLAPAGTPMPIVQKLQDEVHAIIKTPSFKEFTAKLNLTPHGDTSEEFSKTIDSNLARWRTVAKANNIVPHD